MVADLDPDSSRLEIMNHHQTRRLADTPVASRTSPSTRDEEENSDADAPACRPSTRRHMESVP
jgi:hypothetical protein